MSATEGSINSSAGAAPPPAPSPAAAPQPAAPQPAAEPSAPADGSVAQPAAAPSSDAVAPAVQGAPPSTPAIPSTLDAVKQHYRDQLQGKAPVGEGQPEVTPPVEAQPPAPEPAPPIEATPPAEPEAVEPAVEAAPAEEVEGAPIELEGVDYRESVLTPEQIETRYQRKLSKEDRADVAQREAHRGELLEKYNTLGGDIGFDVAKTISEVLWNENPTVEDVDKLFDQVVTAEGAGNHKLFDLMGKHLVNTQLNDPVTGKDFASNMIGQNWGKNPDGTTFDFRGMEPFELVDLLMKASQMFTVDEDGERSPAINLDYLKTEIEGNAPPAKSERELELERKLEAHEAADTTKAEKDEQTRTEAKRVYKTQAMSLVSRQLMDAVLPLAVKANWAPGEKEEGESATEKKEFGELVRDHVNMQVFGPANAPTPDYEAVNTMIEEGTAYDRETGAPSRKFRLLTKDLQNKARALITRKVTTLQPRIQFTSTTSRSTQLAAKNGNTAAQPKDAAPPPLAVAPAQQPDRPLNTEEQLAAERKKFRDRVLASQQAQATGVR